jgi:OmpA-OmpF porin, OOP family
MHKLTLSAAVSVLAVCSALGQTVRAQETSSTSDNWQDNFFAAGNLGQTQYRTSGLSPAYSPNTPLAHNQSVFQNVRFGWRWNGIVGPEIGYVYLGRPKNSAPYFDLTGTGTNNTSLKSRAVTLGVDAKYNFYQHWFVTAHAGYMRSRTRFDWNQSGCRFGLDFSACYPRPDQDVRYKTNNNGVYAGLGIGYDVTRHVSVGLNYDDYRLQAGNDSSLYAVGIGHSRVNVAAYSASVEYRF